MTTVEMIERLLPVEAVIVPSTDLQRTALSLYDLVACIDLTD
jgi:hypothetical protein